MASNPASSNTTSPNSRALSSLLPASSPATTKWVFFDTEPATLPPAASISARASSRPSVGRVPVSTRVLPASTWGARLAAAPSPSGHWMPAARSWSTTSRLCGWSKNVRRLCATTGPTSLTCSNSSSVACITRSSAPKCLARSLAVASPTWRMPSANKKRGKLVCLLLSSPANRLTALLSPMRSSAVSLARPSVYSSGRLRTRPLSTS